MANLSTKIKMYAAANGVADVDFTKDVMLQDDIGDQLDEIYKDIDAWKARIKSIKDANPKQ
jgi:hypothetical protein